jgi:hypothetical protein
MYISLSRDLHGVMDNGFGPLDRANHGLPHDILVECQHGHTGTAGTQAMQSSGSTLECLLLRGTTVLLAAVIMTCTLLATHDVALHSARYNHIDCKLCSEFSCWTIDRVGG